MPARSRQQKQKSGDTSTEQANISVSNTQTKHNSTNNQPSICGLSNELLNDIFLRSVVHPPGLPKPRYASLSALAMTCKRFHALATPLLYRSIDVEKKYTSGSNQLVPPSDGFVHFHRTMKENPSLRTLCKSVIFEIMSAPKATTENFTMADELLPWLMELRSLTVRGGFISEDAWPFLRNALQHLHTLKSVSLQGNRRDLKLQDICHADALANIRNLTLSNVVPVQDESGKDCDFSLLKVNLCNLLRTSMLIWYE